MEENQGFWVDEIIHDVVLIETGQKAKAKFAGFGRGLPSGKIAAVFNLTLEDGTQVIADQTELEFVSKGKRIL